MAERSFALPVRDDPVGRVAGRWLKLGILALLASDVHTILRVLLHASGLVQRAPWIDYFDAALVVDFDLSMLIWPLALAGVLWSLNATRVYPIWDNAAFWLVALGAAVIAISPFLGEGHPVLSHYVPVLRNPVFYAGGWMALAGLGLLALRTLLASRPLGKPLTEMDVLGAGIWFSAFAAVVAGLALVWSWWGLPEYLVPHAYFDSLFWGSGHVLQFTHALLLLVVWLWLADAAGFRVRLSPRGGLNFMAVALAPVLVAPVIYFNAEAMAAFDKVAFTRLMRYGGLTALPLGAVVVLAALSGRARASQAQGYLGAALYCSLVMFACGGIMGLLIEGVGVELAAHYQGSLAGVTLAFMGLSYHLLPRLGYDAPMPHLAMVQLYVYAGGQIMLILGLAWPGGHGNIPPGYDAASRGLDSPVAIAGTSLAGLGELAAILGGLLFAIIAIRAIWLAKAPG